MPAVVLYGPNGMPLNPETIAIVDPTFSALRTALKPHEYQFSAYTGGHYRAVGNTVAAAFSSGANLLDFFFQPANNLVAVVKRVRAHLYVAAAVTAQAMPRFTITNKRSYTAQATTNATALTLSGHNSKMRTSPMSTCQAKIGVANAAAGISGGTFSQDQASIASAPTVTERQFTSLGVGSGWVDLYKADTLGHHPPMYQQNEGFMVRLDSTIATGTVVATLEIEWLETLQF